MTNWPEPKRPQQRWPNALGALDNVLLILRRDAVKEEVREACGVTGSVQLKQAIALLEGLKLEMGRDSGNEANA